LDDSIANLEDLASHAKTDEATHSAPTRPAPPFAPHEAVAVEADTAILTR
jgi:hypothetical protein